MPLGSHCQAPWRASASPLENFCVTLGEHPHAPWEASASPLEGISFRLACLIAYKGTTFPKDNYEHPYTSCHILTLLVTS